MIRIAPAVLLAALAGLPTAALAQRTITEGRPVSGTLSASDPVLDDGSHYQLYTFTARAGERYVVTLRSEDFDAYLAVGAGIMREECDACESDDDGAGGTDARVRITAEIGGTYSIRVNTLSEGETGRYTLSLERAPARAEGSGTRGAVSVGREVSGVLDEADPVAGDDTYYEEWTFRPDFSGTVTITLRSEDFDAYLAFGTGSGDALEQIESDDDSAGGTDSSLTVAVEAGETYTIRANTLSEGESGRYTLILQR